MADRIMKVTIAAEILISRCVNCGVTYGVTQDFDDDRRKDKKSFYCPNGHSMSYRENEADVLRRERDLLKQQNARMEEENRNAWNRVEDQRKQRVAVEKRLKQTQTRIGAGVCPCCNRTVAQLGRHMQSKHPEVPFVPAAPKPKGRVRA